ncbi:MAG: sensor histidine kinase [Lachnospiraceae bacterium]|nr:sensor histidine kinase [Lachnospiraceae bacterium]
MELYQDIPRICTAIAEWGACVAYLYLLKKERMRSLSFWTVSILVLAVQSVFLVVTTHVPVILWNPCMAAAAGIMFLYLMWGGEMSLYGGWYCCARAFLLSELIASLEWQIFTFFQAEGYDCLWLQILLFALVYLACFGLTLHLERPFLTQDYIRQLTVREGMAATGIVVCIFAFSNLSFVYSGAPFTSSFRADIFTIRTLVDFGGVMVLYVYQSRICEYMAEHELSAMNAILKSQYDQYRNYQDSLDLIHMKYHDLKHQITALRAETDEERRRKWLDAMEEEVSAFETMHKTGNQVLDTILAAKAFQCRKQKIQITCVADGKLLDHMHVTDICSMFGNALDNAIEHVTMLADEEKRLIHVSVSARKGFVFIKIENYCQEAIRKNENGFLDTTKADRQNHGYGLRSIYAAAQKYGGSADVTQENNWFELKILMPRG